MAIAGGTKEAFKIKLVNGHLHVGSSQRPLSHLIEDDIDNAVKRLRNGEEFFFLKWADNLARLKAAFGVQP